MAMRLENVVPFGRSLDEYQKMFSLTKSELKSKIIGVADGPASFNAELRALGGEVISIDPIYEFGADEIEERFNAVIDNIIAQVENTPNDWVWSYHGSSDGLRENRMKATQVFTDDYRVNRQSSSYVQGALPSLPFADDQFELGLCSHFLFLYTDHYSYEFHEQSVLEMLRVAKEVRIFPLLTLMREYSPYIEPLLSVLIDSGYSVDVREVEYELQKGGNQMLVIKRASARYH
ncbi:hypothetical protein JIN82_08900 [Persicirhabdus sediminis]|uniref:SAM-dependent methyltransferase n=2 Tax=Persicirhabdus sediminis TaxID=454144 RepID=A0A8J7SMR7_9BACT|nr:hypothetical protein [Persicirhabdus sediminis]